MALVSELLPETINVCRPFIVVDEEYKEIAKAFDAELSKGLSNPEDWETNEESNVEASGEATIKSVLTYISDFPGGKKCDDCPETGNFLVIVFTDVRYKIMLVTLTVDDVLASEQSFRLPNAKKKGESEAIFKHIACSLARFLSKIDLKERRIPLSVVWGFPIEQKSLQIVKHMRWTKGFKCPDLINKEIGRRLQEAFRKCRQLKKVYLVAIIDEASGSLMSVMWKNKDARIGLVVDSGLNMSYVENIDNIGKYDGDPDKQRVIVNIETSEFGDDGTLDLLRTVFDKEMDRKLETKGENLFEKMISGLYLGELARLMIIELIKRGVVLDELISDEIQKRFSLKAEHLARIEGCCDDNDYEGVGDVLEEFGYPESTRSERIQVQFTCRCLVRRSINLVAMSLASMINNRLYLPSVTVACDGVMLKQFPNYMYYLRRKLNQLKSPQVKVELVFAESPGQGAAIVAACCAEKVMDKLERRKVLPPLTKRRCTFLNIKQHCGNPSCFSSLPCDRTEGPNPGQPMRTTSKDITCK